MTNHRDHDYLLGLVRELRNLPYETEWVEFKVNYWKPHAIGEYISALANAAALHAKIHAYMLWGIENGTHDVVGTDFSPDTEKKGNEPLETWLLQLLNPRIDFRFHEVTASGRRVVLLEIDRASQHPVTFEGVEYIRVGGTTRKLKDYPEKERALWRVFDRVGFEDGIAAERVSDEDVRLCEERGSGIDKVVFEVELYQLPAPLFEAPEGFTRTVLFAHRALADMDTADRVRACYLHACLKYVTRAFLTNASLRERFGNKEKNRAVVSRYIREAVDGGMIKPFDEHASRRMMKYVSFWA